jgi:uncharacterized protein
VITQAQTTADTLALEERQITDYLRSHPEFFRQHPLLLAELNIPHPSGTAVSLVERQIHLLRERNQQYEHRLRELVDAARDNQRLTNSLQHLAVNLLLADELDDILATVSEELRANLDTDFISLRLLGTLKQTAHQPERYLSEDGANLQSLGKLIADKHIQCGRMSSEQIKLLFADDAPEVGSGAIIPLHHTTTFGLLAVGGRDAQRYHPGMGTDYLKLLGELVSAAIKPYV